MFSYFEPNYIEKAIGKVFVFFLFVCCFFFSNLGYVIIFAKRKFVFGRHFETQHFLNVIFADLWLFYVYTGIVQVSYRNSYGKVPKNGWVQVDPLVHKREWKVA